MSKPSKSFYATAVSHRDAPGEFLSCFAMPGEPPQWVTRDGKPVVFSSAQDAELAGFRVLAAKLNRSKAVQHFLVSASESSLKALRPNGPRPGDDIHRVFSRFK